MILVRWEGIQNLEKFCGRRQKGAHSIEKWKNPFEVKYTSLNLEGYTPISSKLGHMSFLWRFSSLRGLVLPPSSFPQLILPHGLNEKQTQQGVLMFWESIKFDSSL